MNETHIRWMIRRDMPEVLAIENACYENPWSESEFVTALRQRNIVGMVAEIDDRVSGYMVYQLNKDSLDLLNIAVDPKMWRNLIGAAMVDKLKGKLSKDRRTKITADVRESNYKAQLFFKDRGFVCTELLRDVYDDSEECCYRFVFDVKPQTRHLLKNRVSEVRA